MPGAERSAEKACASLTGSLEVQTAQDGCELSEAGQQWIIDAMGALWGRNKQYCHLGGGQ